MEKPRVKPRIKITDVPQERLEQIARAIGIDVIEVIDRLEVRRMDGRWEVGLFIMDSGVRGWVWIWDDEEDERDEHPERFCVACGDRMDAPAAYTGETVGICSVCLRLYDEADHGTLHKQKEYP